MPKRPKLKPQPPESGEVWQDCYDWVEPGDEQRYLVLELDSETEITFDTRMYRVLHLQSGEVCYRNMNDWLTSWLRLA